MVSLSVKRQFHIFPHSRIIRNSLSLFNLVVFAGQLALSFTSALALNYIIMMNLLRWTVFGVEPKFKLFCSSSWKYLWWLERFKTHLSFWIDLFSYSFLFFFNSDWMFLANIVYHAFGGLPIGSCI